MCDKSGCAAPPTHALKIRVPPDGYPIKKDNCLTMILGLKLCETCAREEKAEEFLKPLPDGKPSQLRMIFRTLAHSIAPHGPAPDFSRAFFDVIPLSDPDFQVLEKQRASKPTGSPP